MNYAGQTDEEQAAMEARMQKVEAKRQVRDVKRAGQLGTMQAQMDHGEFLARSRAQRIIAREKAAGRW